MADKEHPEAYEDLLQAKPKYKDREVDSPVLTAEIKALIDKELELNAVKLATGLKKQRKRATDIHDALLRQGYEVSYRTVVVRYIRNKNRPNIGICPRLLHQAEVRSWRTYGVQLGRGKDLYQRFSHSVQHGRCGIVQQWPMGQVVYH